MKKYNCPSCGAEIIFQSSISVYAVCKYCNSMIVRHDVDVESIGTMAALPDDVSPLQLGTRGFYQGQHFEIIGRMKIGWEEGVWNEWFLYMDDGQRAWLAEAQGSYAVSFEVDASVMNTGKNTHLEPGSYVTINNKKLKVVDVKEATCLGSEGELPFAAPKGRKTKSVDLSGANGEFGSIEILDDKQRVYLGNYVEWDDMRCQNLRPLEGWQ